MEVVIFGRMIEEIDKEWGFRKKGKYIVMFLYEKINVKDIFVIFFLRRMFFF